MGRPVDASTTVPFRPVAANAEAHSAVVRIKVSCLIMSVGLERIVVCLSHLFDYFFLQEYLCGEVVRIAVGPYAARECTQRVALVLAVLLFEKFFVQNFRAYIFESSGTGEQIIVDDYLVEEVPCSAIYI